MPSSAENQLEPARSVISKLGGVDTVALATGAHRTRVFRWMYPSSRGGTGGLIPQRHILTLLDYAASKHVKLSPADFLPLHSEPPKEKSKTNGR